jgi:hypothetical protein
MQHDPADQPERPGYELVMPFTVCRSAGGPYDDDAFVAGFQAGRVDQALEAGAVARASEVRFTVYTTLVKQLELIGMSRGFPVVLAEESSEVPAWSFVTFRVDQPGESAAP